MIHRKHYNGTFPGPAVTGVLRAVSERRVAHFLLWALFGAWLLVAGTWGIGGAPSRAWASEEGMVEPVCATYREEAKKRWPYPMPERWNAARWHHVRGVCHQEAGRLDEAAAQFAQGIKSAPELAPFMEQRLFQIALLDGREGDAARHLKRLFSEDPAPELVMEARKALALWLGQRPVAGREAPVLEVLSAYLMAVPSDGEDALLLLPYYKFIMEKGSPALAQRLELLFWAVPPDQDTAVRWAEVGRKRLEAGMEVAGSDFTLRARNLHILRMYDQQHMELGGSGTPIWPEDVSSRLGSYYFQALVRMKKYERAAREIMNPSVVKRFGFTEETQISTAIGIALRGRRISQALGLIDRWEKKDPKADGLARTYGRLLRYYTDNKQPDNVVRWSRRLIKNFPGHEDSWEGYWLPLWNYYQKREYAKALKWGDLAIAEGQGFHPDVMAQFFYWRGRLLREIGQPEAAKQSLQALSRLWPTSFYGLYVQHMNEQGQVTMARGSKPDLTHPEMSPPSVKWLWHEPMVSPALFLLIVGEEELASGLLGRVIGSPMPDRVLDELGQVFAYFRQFRLQFRWASNYFYTMLKREPVTDSYLWRNAFPLAFWELVDQNTRDHEVNPFFVLAVMREESHYFAQAGSKAGAKGLMQLMPATAQQTASRNRIPYKETHLLQPELNITLGVLYLKHVLARFDDHPIHAAAAYNAGPGAVRKWRKELKTQELDEFVESIPYDETRAYVKRVISSFLIYRTLYQDLKVGVEALVPAPEQSGG